MNLVNSIYKQYHYISKGMVHVLVKCQCNLRSMFFPVMCFSVPCLSKSFWSITGAPCGKKKTSSKEPLGGIGFLILALLSKREARKSLLKTE